ncbi:hypothetical protein AcW2_007211 [Taiwanofungus camphoratus]|nr:hypothetical protein AcW2_007211 [Antrodia cinnamomea]
MPIEVHAPILIVGAGVAGLTLAQSLRQRSVPFLIFERDASPTSRDQGWGLTLHRVLADFLASLPEDIRTDVLSCQVDPAMWENDVDLFVYLNAATMQPDSSFEGPLVGIAKRIRVQREKLRRILMKDLNILWSKRLESFTIVDSGVVAKFGDGTSYEGSILVGADGSHSRVRRSIASEPDLNPLRVSLLGTTVELDHEQATPLLAISPLSILGKDPKTGTFVFIALFDKSPASDPADIRYTYQLSISYPDRDVSTDPSDDSAQELLAKLQSLAQVLHPTLRQPFNLLSADAKVVPINITDWVPTSWDGQGKVTLIGDAAHSMTMFRGDGANQSIADALELVLALENHPIGDALQAFEGKMLPRAKAAVLRSRQACLDIHTVRT